PRDPDGAPLYPGVAKGLSSQARARLFESGVPYALRLDMAAACALVGELGWLELGEVTSAEKAQIGLASTLQPVLLIVALGLSLWLASEMDAADAAVLRTLAAASAGALAGLLVPSPGSALVP